MTVVAIIATGDMVWMFANGCNTVVTRAATTYCLRVIHRIDRRKHIAGMTIFANIARLHMRWALASGIGAVVATNAIARDIDVIEIRR